MALSRDYVLRNKRQLKEKRKMLRQKQSMHLSKENIHLTTSSDADANEEEVESASSFIDSIRSDTLPSEEDSDEDSF